VPREILWTDAEEIGIQLQEKFPDLDPLTVRFTDLHRYVTELPGFADDPAKSNESRLEAIQMAWHEEFEDAKGHRTIPVPFHGSSPIQEAVHVSAKYPQCTDRIRSRHRLNRRRSCAGCGCAFIEGRAG
jgi:FeS assembly protein IscX